MHLFRGRYICYFIVFAFIDLSKQAHIRANGMHNPVECLSNW